MKTTITSFLLLVFLSPILMGNVRVRIKNASRIKGMESYFLTGFGIVVGLNGSGDSDAELTQHTLANVLKHMQIDVDESQLKSSNCAAVSITARVRAGSHKGDMANAIISTIGDATSLQGGTLIMSPVLGTNGKLSAIAQGPLLVGGFAFGETGGG
ncbi:MAG: flagellar basal body P-ring protein FlgI, partial [Lentisphaeraceae bacterium]|nr:flagellar basal body P-ring protein FlgI [Lentisphaeraceae bacterium]